ncbi:MAG: type I glutamate--ammonia ligase, partial [Alphaproteobacteria bacterium]|nr:type I glutamate--ammonia ligase [Alphaproteobacteria bacterium]
MSDIKKALDLMKKNDVTYVDFCFTDSQGKWHHLARHASTMDESAFSEGIMFDGSSVKSWKDIHDSDMILMPDASTALLDPFPTQNTMTIICDAHEPGKKEGYAKDPRSIAKRAEAYMKKTGIADTAYFGPEPEFFIFDDVKYDVSSHNTYFKISAEEAPISCGKDFPEGNSGHRSPLKEGYFVSPPIDTLNDMRAEILTVMSNMGISVEKHHHEVAPSQHEVGFKFGTAVTAADHLQIFKYITKNVAHSYGKSATFMPKPICDDNGSGMHVHQSLWKNKKNLFMGTDYADLSKTAMYYIGGILAHAKALNAFTNPSTNSYKRLVPGYEAPVILAYSARNRSAACRIPHVTEPNGRRIEVRFPDPVANPYLCMASMLMAGLDG